MRTNNLCADIGYMSLNHDGENLCGDHVEMVETEDKPSTVIVLADGLGSGVKASILSTLTSKIISTMIAAGLKLEDCVETIAATLPVCSVRGVAYSTFTIMRIVNNRRAEIIQYDNPKVILLRNGENYEYPVTRLDIGGKSITRADIALCEGDIFIAMSDGVEHAGVGVHYNFGWKRSDIIEFMKTFVPVGFTAKTLTKILLDECDRLYDGKPGDDATVCTVRIRPRVQVNVMFGPPADRSDNERMLSLFFSKEGRHIVCGGTTSTIAAEYLGKPLVPNLEYLAAKNYTGPNSDYEKWSCGQDGASKIARMLFEDATDIEFFVGRAVNPAHQNPNLPINFNIKMRLVEELGEELRKMGKKVKIGYF